MSSMTEGLCVPCSGLNHNDLIPIDQLKQRVEKIIPMWTLHESQNGEDSKSTSDHSIANADKYYYSLNRKFTAQHFQSALECINAIGQLAEEQNHHPDLHITNYRNVHVELFTHKLSGVTENDIILAHAIDTKVQIEYSPKWLKDHPEASNTEAAS